jgi:hypothetical protein
MWFQKAHNSAFHVMNEYCSNPYSHICSKTKQLEALYTFFTSFDVTASTILCTWILGADTI